MTYVKTSKNKTKPANAFAFLKRNCLNGYTGEEFKWKSFVIVFLIATTFKNILIKKSESVLNII